MQDADALRRLYFELRRLAEAERDAAAADAARYCSRVVWGQLLADGPPAARGRAA